MHECNRDAENQQSRRNRNVRSTHRVGDSRLGGRTRRVGQNVCARNQRRNGAAERVQRLRQRQPHRCAMLRPQDRHIRIGSCLQCRDAGTNNEYRRQKQRETHQLGGRNKQKAPYHLNEQRNDHRPLVADGFNQFRRRRREHKISEKERRLRQHRPRIRQIENRPQVRNKRHVQIGNETEDQKQNRDSDEWTGIVRRCSGRCRRGSSCHRLFAPLFLKSSARLGLSSCHMREGLLI